MKKSAILAVLALALAGCEERPPEQQLGQDLGPDQPPLHQDVGHGETADQETPVDPTCEELDALTDIDLDCTIRE